MSLGLLSPIAAPAQTPPDRPFSLLIDGEPSLTRLSRIEADDMRQPRWRDPKTGLVAAVDVVKHAKFGATEWTLHLKNEGAKRSPLLSEIWSGDFLVDVDPVGRPQLFSSEGSSNKPSDFRPIIEELETEWPMTLASFGGRSSDGTMPYFNVFGGRKGAIVAVGWTGNWKAELKPQGPGKVRVRIGMQRAKFRLEPGESVRLPGVLVMPWTGERPASHNQFRRLMLAKYTPTNHPPLALSPIAMSPHVKIDFSKTTEANLLEFVKLAHAGKTGADTIWIDAGWNSGGFPDGIGNPEPDPARFPRGLKPVADLAHQLGFRFLMWFEPERVMANTSLHREHPDWLLEPSGLTPPVAYQSTFRLLDLGNPAARRWTIDYLSRHIEQTGIDIYRHDFNMYPSFYWQTNEPDDRIGIREIRYIEGLYAVWDALLAKFPRLIIDNCASGGRRLDFEMMKRSVPLWRTDYVWGQPQYPRSAQAMTMGLSYWLPIYGQGTTSAELLPFTSGLGAGYPIALDFHDPALLEAIRPMVEALKRARPALIGDFHPLTDYSLDPAATIAMQFHDPGTDGGVIMAFGHSIDLSKIRPRAMNSSEYDWTDWAALGMMRRVNRAEVQRSGLPSLAGPATRPAVVLEYRAVK